MYVIIDLYPSSTVLVLFGDSGFQQFNTLLEAEEGIIANGYSVDDFITSEAI